MDETTKRNELDFEKLWDLGHHAVDRLMEHLAGLPDGPVYEPVPSRERQAMLVANSLVIIITVSA
jgi:hypothetical protein